MPKRSAIAAALGLALAASASAEPALDYSVGVSLKHSDNINYSEHDPVSEDVLAPRLDFTFTQKGSTLQANAAGSLEYRDYLHGRFGSELHTLLAGTAIWTLLPERLDWFFQDNAGREPINALQSNAPSNQQQTNVFTTGPTLHARFGEALQGQFDARYTNTYADTSSQFNSDRYSALGALLYTLTPSDTLSGNVSGSQVRYDRAQSRGFDYERQDAYLGYQRTSRAFTLEGAVGYSHLDLKGGEGSRSGSLLRASVRWNPNPRTSVGLWLARQYSDAAQDLVFSPEQIRNTGIGSGINGSVLTPQVYVEKRVNFDVRHREDRFYFDVAPFWRELDYVLVDGSSDVGLNQHSTGFYADAGYFFLPTLWLEGNVGRERRRYTDIARTDDDLAYGVSLNYKRSRHWQWALLARHERRDSDTPNNSYDENSVMLTVTFHR
jgi:hypothetical protein